MKITKSQLKQIIREEYSRILKESYSFHGEYIPEEMGMEEEEDDSEDLVTRLYSKSREFADEDGVNMVLDKETIDHSGNDSYISRYPLSLDPNVLKRER